MGQTRPIMMNANCWLGIFWQTFPSLWHQRAPGKSDEQDEQVYVVVRGRGQMSVAGDTGDIAEGDLVLVPPATDHAISNSGEGELACVSIQSPPVAVSEMLGRQMAEVTSYDEDDE